MKNNAVVGLLVVVLLASLGGNYYLWDKSTKSEKEVKKLMKDPNAVAKKEADDVLGAVGKLLDLPKDEKPTIATIADKTKIDVKQQPFFTNAANGDKVLLYVKAKKAILFRPSVNKIIEVGTLNVQQQNQPAAPTEKPKPTAK